MPIYLQNNCFDRHDFQSFKSIYVLIILKGYQISWNQTIKPKEDIGLQSVWSK